VNILLRWAIIRKTRFYF